MANSDDLTPSLLRLIITTYGSAKVDHLSDDQLLEIWNRVDTLNQSRLQHFAQHAPFMYEVLQPQLESHLEESPESEIKKTEIPAPQAPATPGAVAEIQPLLEAEPEPGVPNEEEKASIEFRGKIPLPDEITLPVATVGHIYDQHLDLSPFRIPEQLYKVECEGVSEVDHLAFHVQDMSITGTPREVGTFEFPLHFTDLRNENEYQVRLVLQVQPDRGKLPKEIVLETGKMYTRYHQIMTFDARFKEDLQVIGLTDTGLEFTSQNMSISGTPTKAGTFDLFLDFHWHGDPPQQRIQVPLTLVIEENTEPQWETKEPDADLPYPKSHHRVLGQNSPKGHILVGASKRGLGPAHEGKFRNDDFSLRYRQESGWYLMCLADGAQHATFSRKGAELVCKVSEQVLAKRIEEKRMEETKLIQLVDQVKGADHPFVNAYFQHTLVTAVYNAYRYVERFALHENLPISDFGTTLSVFMIKPLPDMRWFCAGLSLGDGVAVAFEQEKGILTTLGVPDAKHFRNNPLLLTDPEIGANVTFLKSQLAYAIISRPDVILAMTDGVAEAKFGSYKSFASRNTWQALWQDVHNHVVSPFTSLNNVESNLLKWLDFWAPGHHDDRTLAMLLPEHTINAAE